MVSLETLLLSVPAILIALTFHEFAHAAVAYRLGDPTPRYQGRLTLSPLAHLDPLGALMLLIFRFGWAKPVQVNPIHFKDARKGMLLVALAGPLANVALAWLFNLLAGMVPLAVGGWTAWLWTFLRYSVSLNLWLAAFNLIPIPPLDGSKILMGLLPGRHAYAFAQLEHYGPLLLVFFIVSGMTSTILRPIYRALAYLVTGA